MCIGVCTRGGGGTVSWKVWDKDCELYLPDWREVPTEAGRPSSASRSRGGSHIDDERIVKLLKVLKIDEFSPVAEEDFDDVLGKWSRQTSSHERGNS